MNARTFLSCSGHYDVLYRCDLVYSGPNIWPNDLAAKDSTCHALRDVTLIEGRL